MATEKGFIAELVISGIDLLHTSMEDLIQYVLEHVLLYDVHSKLSTE